MRATRTVILPLALISLVLAACAGDAASEAPASQAAVESDAAEPSEAAPPPSEEPAESAEASEAAEDDEVTVRLDGFAFDTSELTVPVGTEVTWLNTDAAAHTVTEGTDGQAADSPIIDAEIAGGQATSHTFDEPGTYEITCLFHPSMNMTVTVEG